MSHGAGTDLTEGDSVHFSRGCRSCGFELCPPVGRRGPIAILFVKGRERPRSLQRKDPKFVSSHEQRGEIFQRPAAARGVCRAEHGGVVLEPSPAQRTVDVVSCALVVAGLLRSMGLLLRSTLFEQHVDAVSRCGGSSSRRRSHGSDLHGIQDGINDFAKQFVVSSRISNDPLCQVQSADGIPRYEFRQWYFDEVSLLVGVVGVSVFDALEMGRVARDATNELFAFGGGFEEEIVVVVGMFWDFVGVCDCG